MVVNFKTCGISQGAGANPDIYVNKKKIDSTNIFLIYNILKKL
jgi:hypothetical protein